MMWAREAARTVRQGIDIWVNVGKWWKEIYSICLKEIFQSHLLYNVLKKQMRIYALDIHKLVIVKAMKTHRV